MTIRLGVLTISDRSSRGEREDLSGPALARLIQTQGWSLDQQAIVPDDESTIRETFIEWADSDALDVILESLGQRDPAVHGPTVHRHLFAQGEEAGMHFGTA